MDVYDFHWYPEATDSAGARVINLSSPKLTDDQVQAVVQSPRSFWDKTYKEKSWITNDVIGQPIAILDRLQTRIDAEYPGMKLALTEYDGGGRSAHRRNDCPGGQPRYIWRPRAVRRDFLAAHAQGALFARRISRLPQLRRGQSSLRRYVRRGRLERRRQCHCLYQHRQHARGSRGHRGDQPVLRTKSHLDRRAAYFGYRACISNDGGNGREAIHYSTGRRGHSTRHRDHDERDPSGPECYHGRYLLKYRTFRPKLRMMGRRLGVKSNTGLVIQFSPDEYAIRYAGSLSILAIIYIKSRDKSDT